MSIRVLLAGAAVALLACGGDGSGEQDASADGGAPAGDVGTVDLGGADAAPMGPVCPASWVVCDGTCVDTRADPAHCGACGNACATDETCAAEPVERLRCLPCPDDGARIVCDGACVNRHLDTAHCGACGNACSGDQYCASPECRPCSEDLPFHEICDGRCVWTINDPAHCGGCGRTCAEGEHCASGDCFACALDHMMICDGRCVEQSDPAHCGACGNACAPGEGCGVTRSVEGTCVPCEPPSALCDGRCVNLLTDSARCGACDQACGLGERCVAGACQPCGGATEPCCEATPACEAGLACRTDCVGGVMTCTSDPFGGTTCTCSGTVVRTCV